MKKAIKIFTFALSIFCAAIMALTFYGDKNLPDVCWGVNDEISFSPIFNAIRRSDMAVDVFSGKDGDATADYDVKLLNVFPVKTLRVNITDRKYLAAGGELVGIKLHTRGVLVVGTESFESENGQKAGPAAEAGIVKGDSIISIDGREITDNASLTSVIENSQGKTLTVGILRSEKELTLYMKPEKSAATGLYKGGLWVRDSTVGVGTLTFCDLEENRIAALGHGIYDADTSSILSVSDGEIISASVSSVKKGVSGTPGEITGLIGGNTLGSITLNSDEGIFGELYYIDGEPDIYPVATISEVHTGKAQIICSVSDGGKQYYDVEISRINGSSDSSKNMTVKITDQTLLALTGGIVQGMSGSPVIQDGYIVGAITHVFVNDPKSGYAIFAENMLNAQE